MQLRSQRVIDAAGISRAGLYDLPPEMLDWIISYSDRVDLLNLALVCKSMKKLVEPYLYAAYVNKSLQHRRPVLPYLQNLIAKSDIAQHVRSVELGPWTTKRGFLDPHFRRNVRHLPHDVFTSLVDAAKQAGLLQSDHDCNNLKPIKKNEDLWYECGPGYDSDGYVSDDVLDASHSFNPLIPRPRSSLYSETEFLRCLHRGIEDPQLLLLLSLLPRLHELKLKGPRISEGLSWARICSQESTGLRALKVLHVAGDFGECPWDFTEINAVLHLPSLRELHAYMAASHELDIPFAKVIEVEPDTLSITNLFLERCSLGKRTIQLLVAGCKSLESFMYISGGGTVGPDQFRAPDVKKNLLKHKATLKCLTLDLSEWHTPRPNPSFRSLADFTGLEKAIFDYGTLRWHLNPHAGFNLSFDDTDDENDDVSEDVDVHAANTQPPLPELLPPCLKELVIFQAPPIIVENLLAFETAPRTQNPQLQTIKIHTDQRRAESEEDYRRLPEIFREKGIHYEQITRFAQVPLSSMRKWVYGRDRKALTRWNPQAKRYEGFRSWPAYAQFCDKVLGMNRAKIAEQFHLHVEQQECFDDDTVNMFDFAEFDSAASVDDSLDDEDDTDHHDSDDEDSDSDDFESDDFNSEHEDDMAFPFMFGPDPELAHHFFPGGLHFFDPFAFEEDFDDDESAFLDEDSDDDGPDPMSHYSWAAMLSD